ncbi:efflux transporter outer membrane subunit [Rhodovulum sp. DZ06]|uniref:efflux transporter outer membrane subunit n=1 Tax=Rhodovulum sp. DZ06 TaxID=3425126 RepID=UPI003D34157C
MIAVTFPRPPRLARRGAALAALALAAGCTTVGPDYIRPEAPLTARFAAADAPPQGAEAPAPLGAVAQEEWWDAYRDPILSELTARGLAQDLSTQAAAARIRRAEAALRRAGGPAPWSGDLTAGWTASGGEGYADEASAGGLGAALVIDLFGGLERARQGAEADLASARAAEETARLAWAAALVAAYSDARYNQEALALTRQTIAAREETTEITRRQRAAGAATEYELAEIEALLANARAAAPGYAAGFEANVFAIATLLAEPARPLMARMQKGAPLLRIPETPASGVPADLLRNRPDVRGAEADLASAVAAAGVAEAALYPSLTLSGEITLSTSGQGWSFGPALRLPVFNQPALRAERDGALAAVEAAKLEWQASVLSAVEDVQIAQSALSRGRQRAAALRTAARGYDRALRLARENYRSGAISLLDLLDTDRNAAAARISAASAANEAAKAWATLKIATGAGAGAGAGG